MQVDCVTQLSPHNCTIICLPGCRYESSSAEIDQGEKILLLNAHISERVSERLQVEYTPISGERTVNTEGPK